MLSLPLVGQQKLKFSVDSFEYNPFDLSAQNAKFDVSGDRYAIIKVTSTNPNDNLKEYNFNFGNLRHFIEEHEGELWVYVQKNAKTVTISRNGYFTINKYDLHTTIESAKTYAMILSSTTPIIHNQMVQFSLKPSIKGAVVMVKKSVPNAKEEMIGSTDETGSVAKSMEYGAYTYKVITTNYHTSEGRFVLNDKRKTHIETIELRANFSEITLKTGFDADIFVDGEKKGKGTWTGILKAGNHQVECVKENYKNSIQTIVVGENDNKTIELADPIAITGTVAITSTPLDAEITIDGKKYGETPININDLVIGEHMVSVSKENFCTKNEQIEIRENETTNLNVVLESTAQITIHTKPEGANVYMDGAYIGKTPYSLIMSSGSHNIKFTHEGYNDFSKRVYFDISNPNATFELNKSYYNKNRSTLSLYANMNGFGVSWERYFGKNVIEPYFCFGLKFMGCETVKSDEVYEYWPHVLGLKYGREIVANNRLSISPRVGVFCLVTQGSLVSGTSQSAEKWHCLTGCASLSIKINFALTKRIGVFLTPEYRLLALYKDEFKPIADLSSTISSWATGFNIAGGFGFTL